MLVLMSEGGEIKQDTNINFLLEEFGIMVNNGKFHAVMDLMNLHCCRCGDPHCVLQVLPSQRSTRIQWNP